MRPFIAMLTAVVTLAVADSASAARTTIAIDRLAFARPLVTVKRGTSVVWKDKESFVTHTVTSRGKDRFRSSGLLQSGDEHGVRFDRSGTYRYVCRIHTFMKGRIVVT